jgi:release factor glutamine methyltransferase
VYEPSDDTWLLLRAARVEPGERVLEVGTGCGVVAWHAAKQGAKVVATDINPSACRAAWEGARAHGLEVSVVRCDLFAGLHASFDVVLFNPPYLPGSGGDWAARAWEGGAEGSDVSLRCLGSLRDHLRPGGRAYLVLADGNERALAFAEASYRLRRLARSSLFFEGIGVYELR